MVTWGVQVQTSLICCVFSLFSKGPYRMTTVATECRYQPTIEFRVSPICWNFAPNVGICWMIFLGKKQTPPEISDSKNPLKAMMGKEGRRSGFRLGVHLFSELDTLRMICYKHSSSMANLTTFVKSFVKCE